MNEAALYSLLQTIPDPRMQDDRLKHKLIDVLVITVVGVFSGCENLEEIHRYAIYREQWLRQFLELPHGIPSVDTLSRVLSLIDSKAVEQMFRQWVELWKQTHELKKKEVVAVDGKFVNGSRQKPYDSRSTLITVSAYATEAGICLGTEQSHLKKDEGEKRATESLVESLFLVGTIVTLDANGATPRIVTRICEKKADWLIGLKANQKSLLKLAHYCFEQDQIKKNLYSTEQTSHGRHEKRDYHQITIADCDLPAMHKNWEKQIQKWPSIKSLVRVDSERTVTENGKSKTTKQEKYYFSSLTDDVQDVAHAIRAHWAVENNLHWTIDVAFREDHWQVRRKQAVENLSIIRRLVLNMLKQETTAKCSTKIKLKLCSWDPTYLEKVIFAQPAVH